MNLNIRALIKTFKTGQYDVLIIAQITQCSTLFKSKGTHERTFFHFTVKYVKADGNCDSKQERLSMAFIYLQMLHQFSYIIGSDSY